MYRVRRLPSRSATPLFASLSLTPTLRRYHGGLRSDSYGDGGGGGGGGGYGRGRGRGGGGGQYGQYPAYSRGGYTRGGGGGRSRGHSYTNVMTDDYPPHHPYGNASYSGELTPQQQQQQQQLPSASPAYGTQREMSAGNRLGAASPPSSLSSQPCRAFWSQTVRHVPTVDLKRQHVAARTHDKRSRFLVRSRIRDDGVLSNLFPLHFLTTSEAAERGGGNSLAPQRDAYVYVYEMYVTRLVSPGAGSAARPPGSVPPAAQKSPQQLVERRVYPGRSWRAIQRFLRHKYSVGADTAASPLPPLVQLENKIYAAAPLPADALRLPRTYYDVGWKTAELRLVSRSRLVELPPAELQMVVNKIVFEAARSTFRSRKRSSTAAALASDQKEVRRGGGEAEEAGGAGDGDGCGTLEVVREKTGKLVCTMQGVSSGGIRIYRGINVQAVFVDSTAAAALTCEDANTNTSGSAHSPHHHHHSSAAAPQSSPRPPAAAAAALQIATRHLAETPVGLTSAPPIQFRVDAFLRAFTYRNMPVESYRFSDASGSVLASVWAPATPQSLVVGAVYTAAPVRIREFPERNNARLVELPAGTTPTLVRAPEAAAPPASPAASTRPEANAQTEGSVGLPALPSRQPGHISLKIDTKGTIAAELSVWGEVLQHYGPGPYDGATQQRIQKALVDMPVVISYSLRQGIIRDIRFDGEALLTAASASAASDTLQRSLADGEGAGGDVKESGDTTASRSLSAAAPFSPISAREPRLLSLLPYLDAQQPCAVLNDGTLVPLQVLHCCFDPTMRSWQDVASAVLSLMPDDRMALLTVAQDLLAAGLRRWGIVVARTPWRTKALSLLPAPMKAVQPRHAMPLAIPGAAAFPSTVAVIGIAGPRCTDDQTQRVAQTAQHMAQYLRTRLVACLSDESSAVQYVHDHLMHNSSNAAGGGGVSVPISSPSSSQLRDVNTSVVVITTEPDTRATRWLKVECLSRGVHLITLPPSSSPRKLNVLCAGIRRQIATQFELDPLRGVDLRAEVPVLGRRTVLIIGVDTCHTNAHSIGTIVGIVSTPHGNHLLSHFWKHAARGREASQVAVHFRTLLQKAVAYYGAVHEVIVFQDGDVFSELAGMKDELAAQLPGCGLTFMCLHKRCNVRFTHHTPDTNGDASSSSSASSSRSTHGGAYRDNHSREAPESAGYHNLVKGVVITALAPVPLDFETAAPSFYLQAHESALSTARAVQYTVHHISPTLDVADVQQMANVMANVMAPQATKLPMSTRCAHRLADRAERLLDAVPQLTSEMIPRPLSDRLWFL